MDKPEIRVYLDETRHLKVNSGPMVLGGVWGTRDECASFNNKIKMIKIKHNVPIKQELKWTKVSPAKIDYYRDILRLFVDEPDINYRGVVIDKELIDNDLFGHTDDDFYYKMQYLVIRNIASHRSGKYRLFFDYKDTWSSYKANRTVEFLQNTAKLNEDDFEAQPLRSDEVALLQVADFLNGLLAYANSSDITKETGASVAKKKLVRLLQEETGICLNCSSPNASEKINILIWEPKVC